jgi:hypothetical protein
VATRDRAASHGHQPNQAYRRAQGRAFNVATRALRPGGLGTAKSLQRGDPRAPAWRVLSAPDSTIEMETLRGFPLQGLRPRTFPSSSRVLRTRPRQTFPRWYAAGEGEGEARGGGGGACGVPKAGELPTRSCDWGDSRRKLHNPIIPECARSTGGTRPTHTPGPPPLPPATPTPAGLQGRQARAFPFGTP